MAVVVKNTNTIEFSYIEPTESIDGSPLDDLKETRCYMKPTDGLASVVKIEPAVAPTGGNKVVVVAQANVLPNTQDTFECWVTAVDFAGNESPKSNTVQVRIDMVAPKAPLL